MTSQRRGVRGVTLVETQIAGVVLAVGLTAIFSSFGTFASFVKTHERRTEAAAIAHAVLEEFVVDARIDTRLQTQTTGSYNTDTFGRETAQADAPYQVSWTAAPGPNARLRTVTVTVSWALLGRRHQVELSTYVFRA